MSAPRRTLLPVEPARVPRRWRRAVVAGLYGGFAGMAALGLAPGGATASPERSVAAGIFALVATVCMLAQVSTTRPLAQHFRADLDERERADRDRAYRNAYVVLAVLTLLVSVWVFFGGAELWWPQTQWQRNVLLWAVLLVVLSLPISFMAWTEPDPLPEEPRRPLARTSGRA
jgi:drug/metabolite transporter (DMT)-like permease